ncbi:MAG: hypothetical protein AAFY53_11155 [Pseudomonadota bacterium]
MASGTATGSATGGENIHSGDILAPIPCARMHRDPDTGAWLVSQPAEIDVVDIGLSDTVDTADSVVPSPVGVGPVETSDGPDDTDLSAGPEVIRAGRKKRIGSGVAAIATHGCAAVILAGAATIVHLGIDSFDEFGHVAGKPANAAAPILDRAALGDRSALFAQPSLHRSIRVDAVTRRAPTRVAALPSATSLPAIAAPSLTPSERVGGFSAGARHFPPPAVTADAERAAEPRSEPDVVVPVVVAPGTVAAVAISPVVAPTPVPANQPDLIAQILAESRSRDAAVAATPARSVEQATAASGVSVPTRNPRFVASVDTVTGHRFASATVGQRDVPRILSAPRLVKLPTKGRTALGAARGGVPHPTRQAARTPESGELQPKTVSGWSQSSGVQSERSESGGGPTVRVVPTLSLKRNGAPSGDYMPRWARRAFGTHN